MPNQNKDGQWILIDGEGYDPGNLSDADAELVKHRIDLCEQAVAAARESGDRREEGTALLNLGVDCLFFGGQLKRAIEHYGQALSIFREICGASTQGSPAWTDARREEAKVLGRLAQAYTMQQEFKQAFQHHVQAFEIYTEIHDLPGAADQLSTLGLLLLSTGRRKSTGLAIEQFQLALAISRDIADRGREARVLDNMGVAHLVMRQMEDAFRCHAQALTISREIGDRDREANALCNLGAVYSCQGQAERARECYEQALPIYRESDDRASEARVLAEIGATYSQSGQVEKAIEITQAAVQIYEEMGGGPGADRAQERLDRLVAKKSRRKIPIGAVIAIALFVILAAIFYTFAGYSTSKLPSVTSIPTTGTITGKILDKNRNPLVNIRAEQAGMIVLVCRSDDLDVECLPEDSTDMDISVLISSICDNTKRAKTCLLHWGQGAAKIGVDGSYTLRGIPPGQYDLLLIIIDSGLVLTLHLNNVEPVQAGKVTKYDFVTK